MLVFVDTNVLVYAEDTDAGHKHEKARDLVLGLWDNGNGVLSIQVLQEFFVTVTRKVGKPLSKSKAGRIVQQYLTWNVIENSGPLLLAAIELCSASRISFWDAMIVQAARQADCGLLLTEDLGHGQHYGRLRVANPFL